MNGGPASSTLGHTTLVLGYDGSIAGEVRLALSPAITTWCTGAGLARGFDMEDPFTPPGDQDRYPT